MSDRRDWGEIHALWTSGSTVAALEAARRLTATHPGAPPWIVIGDCLCELARFDEALTALKKAERMMSASRRHMVWHRRGRVYEALGDDRAAERWSRKAIAADPGCAEYRIVLGAMLAGRGRFAEARELFRGATRLRSGPRDEAYLNLGLIARAEGRYALALRHLERAIAIDPEDIRTKRARDDVRRAIEIRKVGASQRGAPRKKGTR